MKTLHNSLQAKTVDNPHTYFVVAFCSANEEKFKKQLSDKNRH
jgi:hypothetical protein